MRERHIWGEEYRGIYMEVVSWKWPEEVNEIFSNRENWCGYIYLNSKNHPEIASFEVDYRAYTDGVDQFDRYPFHGGVTFSEVTLHNGSLRMKIGCDYQHYGDEGMEYDHNSVFRDLKKVVDAYREDFPEKVNA